MKTHGMHGTPTYYSWRAMKGRCLNQNDPAYHNYGGRGISVCREWLSFEGFFADMGTRPENTELDRIDNDKGYSKSNCRWASRRTNIMNRRNTKRTPDGRSLYDLAVEHGLHPDTVAWRLKHGKPLEDAILLPAGALAVDRRQIARASSKAKLYDFGGERLILSDVAGRLHIPRTVLSKRLETRSFEVAVSMPYKPRKRNHAN